MRIFRLPGPPERRSVNSKEHAQAELIIDPQKATAYRGGGVISLTAKEFQALSYLDSKRGALCSKDELARQVWPEYEGAVDDDNIDQLVSRLRRKLEPDPRQPRYLLTVRGLGYRLEASGATANATVQPRQAGRALRLLGVAALALTLPGVALALGLLGSDEQSGKPTQSSSALAQWSLRDEDNFSSPEKSLFPKGAGSTNVGFIFARDVENGEYVIRILRGPERSGLSSTTAPVFLERFAFEAEVRSNGQLQYGLTLFWGSADFIQIRLSPAAGTYELFHGPEGTLARREDSPLIRRGEAMNHLRFEVRGNELALLINGTVAEKMSLDSIARRPATPGLFLFVPSGQEISEGSGIRVVYDNFRLFVAAE